MKIIEDILEELYKFSINVMTFHAPLEDETPLLEFEKKYNIKLPKDYKYLLSKHDGIGTIGYDVLGIKEDNCNLITNYEPVLVEVLNPQFRHIIPFSTDGSYGYYCFDTSKIKGDSCPVVVWHSDCSENENLVVDSPTFSDWLKQIFINEALENYDYEGNDKDE